MCLREDGVQALPLFQPLFQPGGHIPQFLVAKAPEPLLQGQHLVHQGLGPQFDGPDPVFPQDIQGLPVDGVRPGGDPYPPEGRVPPEGLHRL